MAQSHRKQKVKGFLEKNLLTILTLVGVVGGGILGVVLKNYTKAWTDREIMYLQYPGELFLRMLKGLIVPLLISSITSAIGSLDLKMSGRIAYRAIIYYFTTTFAAVILGIILVMTIRPGYGTSGKTLPTNGTGEPVGREVLTSDTLLDLVRNLFPPNIIEATIAQHRTILIKPTDFNGTQDISEYKISSENVSTTNVLGMVMFSIILGVAIGKMQEKGRALQEIFVAMSEAMMTITSWVILISPIGVTFLVAAKMMEFDSFADAIDLLGLYFITVMLGLIIHGFGTIAVIFFLVVKELPYKYIGQMSQVLATAFGTGSSSATMPVTINCLDNMGIDPRVTRFVIPVGATINMDGTALYEAVAAIFIAQYRGVALSFGHIVAVSITATAASIGAAGIPQAGLVTMVMVLDTVGLPADDVILIIAVDWLLDRFRTTINVMCDAIGTILVNHLSKSDLQALPDSDLAEPHELQELKSTKE